MYYLFVTTIPSHKDGILVASCETERQALAIGKKLNRCEFYTMNGEDVVLTRSWEEE